MVKVIIVVMVALMVWCLYKFDDTGNPLYFGTVAALSVPMFILLASEVLWQ